MPRTGTPLPHEGHTREAWMHSEFRGAEDRWARARTQGQLVTGPAGMRVCQPKNATFDHESKAGFRGYDTGTRCILKISSKRMRETVADDIMQL